MPRTVRCSRRPHSHLREPRREMKTNTPRAPWCCRLGERTACGDGADAQSEGVSHRLEGPVLRSLRRLWSGATEGGLVLARIRLAHAVARREERRQQKDGEEEAPQRAHGAAAAGRRATHSVVGSMGHRSIIGYSRDGGRSVSRNPRASYVARAARGWYLANGGRERRGDFFWRRIRILQAEEP